MDNIELILTDLGEEATKRWAYKQKPKDLKENIKVAKDGGSVAKSARDSLENKLKEKVVTSDNKLNYQYNNEKESLIEKTIKEQSKE